MSARLFAKFSNEKPCTSEKKEEAFIHRYRIIKNHRFTIAQSTCGSVKVYRIFLFSAILYSLLNTVESCMPQYEKELRYLNYYMGVAPANEDGALEVNAAGMDAYIERASQLNCDLHAPCLWANTRSDGLLDTSDFFLFDKVDTKPFPIQIRPGNANPQPGTFFLLAGNTTSDLQSAVLLSAPVLCQNSDGILTFEYWLYNMARVEVLLLRVNRAHGHLQVVSRPPIDCHFLKMSALCRVEIRRGAEPFRLAVRAFALGDANIGGFAMINNIRYEAEVCGAYEHPKFFNGVALNRWLRQTRPIRTAADLNCGVEENAPRAQETGVSLMRAENCLWAAAAPPTAAAANAASRAAAHGQWSVGNSTYQWDSVVRAESRPYGEFLYQYVDPMADLSLLPQLRSVLVPCTRSPSALTFKYWLSPGTQAQLCTVSAENVELSCVYLNDVDMPGPVRVDIDAADRQPFRFLFSVIKFSPEKGGLIALDEIEYKGQLCYEGTDAAENNEIEELTPKADGSEETFLSTHELGTVADDEAQIGDNKLLAQNTVYSRSRQYGSRTNRRKQSILQALFRTQPLRSQITNEIELESQFPAYSPTLDCDFDVDMCSHWTQNLAGDDDVKSSNNDERFITSVLNDRVGERDTKAGAQRLFEYATIPAKTPFPHLAEEFQRNAAIVIFGDIISPQVRSEDVTEFALFTSQLISCAQGGRLIVTYYTSGEASLSVCANEHCVAQRRTHGNLSVTVSARQPFRLRIFALSAPKNSRDERRFAPTQSARRFAQTRATMERYRSAMASDRRRRPFRYRYAGSNHGTVDSVEERRVTAAKFPAFVLVKQIRAEGAFCRLETADELACKALSCDFKTGSLCGYKNIQLNNADTEFHQLIGKGAFALLSASTGRRAVLQSPRFRLSAQADLRFEAALTTFGSRLYICPGDFAASTPREAEAQGGDALDRALDASSCQLLMGPRLNGASAGRLERIRVSLDASVRRFAFVAIHEAYDAFGDARFLIRNVALLAENEELTIC